MAEWQSCARAHHQREREATRRGQEAKRVRVVMMATAAFKAWKAVMKSNHEDSMVLRDELARRFRLQRAVLYWRRGVEYQNFGTARIVKAYADGVGLRNLIDVTRGVHTYLEKTEWRAVRYVHQHMVEQIIASIGRRRRALGVRLQDGMPTKPHQDRELDEFDAFDYIESCLEWIEHTLTKERDKLKSHSSDDSDSSSQGSDGEMDDRDERADELHSGRIEGQPERRLADRAPLFGNDDRHPRRDQVPDDECEVCGSVQHGTESCPKLEIWDDEEDAAADAAYARSLKLIRVYDLRDLLRESRSTQVRVVLLGCAHAHRGCAHAHGVSAVGPRGPRVAVR
jgi:hypothetical protein